MHSNLPGVTDADAHEITELAKRIYRLAEGRDVNVALAALGIATNCVLSAKPDDDRLEAAEVWCSLLLTNARRTHGHA